MGAVPDMGQIALSTILPPRFSRPDDSSLIGTWAASGRTKVMPTGFSNTAEDQILLGKEVPARVKICPRSWPYRHPTENRDMRAPLRWRLEIAVDARKAAPLKPNHALIVALTPYGNAWVQSTRFKNYSNKGERPLARPSVKTTSGDELITWLELNAEYDPWQKAGYYVAGISLPKDFLSQKPRDIAERFVFGACPDFNEMAARLWESKAVKGLLERTEANKIDYWYRPAGIAAPALESEVIADRVTLMAISIHQALAGPRKSPKNWFGRPITDLVECIYKDHLNERNKAVSRRRKREQACGPAVERFT